MARRFGVWCCFLLSGATALAYEVVWMRLLTLILGATVLGVGTVLAAYMAGLALGSRFWSARADRCERPLRLYAWLELGAALTCALTPWLGELIKRLYTALFVGGISDFSALSAVRFLLCFPVIVAPTFLMGGTLPVLARYCATSRETIGRGAGTLYALNTLGAVAGTLLAGFTLIPLVGVKGTLYLAVGVNLLVAGWAGWLARSERPLATAWEAAPTATTPLAGVDSRMIRAVLLGYGLQGLAAMIYEVAWTRGLVQVFGNSTYAFTTMLAAFLIGLALGAAICGRFVDRVERPVLLFAGLQCGAGLWAAAATPLIEFLPPVFLRVYRSSGGDFASLQGLQFLVCALLLLPTTLCLGAAFPVASRIFAAAAGGAGVSTGQPYAINTLGTLLGSVLAGFILLPRLGIERSVALGAALNLLVAVGLFVGRRWEARQSRLAVVFGLLAVVALGRLVAVGLDPRVLSAGMYMYPEYFLTALELRQPLEALLDRQQLRYHREGYGSSIAILELEDGNLTLQANGKTDASTRDLATQRVLAHLPLLLHPAPEDVLVIGLASGCTTGSVLLHPVRRVDCVEIEPAMVEAAGWFRDWNHDCLTDPRLNLILGDGRNHVLMTRQQYDVITAEPTNPWIAGVNNLFCREYFLDCARRLRPGGVMCQWLPAYNLTETELRIALNTFRAAFPYVTLWAFPNQRTDFFAIGSAEPMAIDPERLRRTLAGPILADARAGAIDSLFHLLGGLIQYDPATAAYSRGAPLNTDERPRLEFSTPRHLYRPELKARTIQTAYTAGAESALAVPPTAATEFLRALLPEANDETLTGAVFRPAHPDPVAPPGLARDLAQFDGRGRRRWRLAPEPSAAWPPTLQASQPVGRTVPVDLPGVTALAVSTEP